MSSFLLQNQEGATGDLSNYNQVNHQLVQFNI